MSLNVDESVHCIELNTKLDLTGFLLISKHYMRVTIYSYGNFFFLKSEFPVFLRTSKLDFVSVYQNISGESGRSSRGSGRGSDEYETVYYQEIISNIVIVGHDRWELTDRIKRVNFKVNGIDNIFFNKEKIGVLSRKKFASFEDSLLLQVRANGLKLSVWYEASYSASLDTPKSIRPTFEFEFDVPLDVYEYTKYLSDLLSFLSLLFGITLAPRDIHIDRLSLEEVRKLVETLSYLGDHRVHYIWPEDEAIEGGRQSLGSPVRAYDDDELASMRAVLISWMDRAGEWRKSYQMMMASFSSRQTISSERLINACRWLEEIPGGKPQQSLKREDLAKISAAASEAAVGLGYPEAMRRRIEGAISQIRTETSEDRFNRLVTSVRERFGKEVLPENIIDHLTRAVRFRGKVAHGHFEPQDEAESRAYYKSLSAMEALCLLLTFRDLPISEESRGGAAYASADPGLSSRL